MKRKILISILIIIMGGLIGNGFRFLERKPDRRAEFSVIPNRYPGYFGAEQEIEDFADDILKADVSTLRDFVTMQGQRLQLFIAYFGSQKYGSQIHSPKHCLPGGGWRIERIEPYVLDLGKGRKITINRLVIAVNNYRAIMLYWYETRSGIIRDEYGLKADLVKNSLLFRSTDAAIVRLTVDATHTNLQQATEEGVKFLQMAYPDIEKSLPF